MTRSLDFASGRLTAESIYLGDGFQLLPNIGTGNKGIQMHSGVFNDYHETDNDMRMYNNNQLAMIYGDDGIVRKPNHPVFSADGAPVYSAGATMVFGNAKINQGSNYNAASGVFTAPVTGKYYFEVYCLVNMGAGSGAYGMLYFGINGSSHNPVLHSNTSYTRAYEPLSFADVVSLAEGDTLYANLGLYNGATSFGPPYNSFKGFLIG